MVEMDVQNTIGVEIAQEKGPDYQGHRKRLREKYGIQGVSALQDYELLELLL